ncbi:MAG: porin family protein [Chromatiales bacterium]|nr:MAG: porin family protein [Chromatiales bacterium]
MNSVQLIATSTLLTAALASGPAFAGADSGFYLGAGVGQASVGDINIDGGEGFSFDGDDTGYKAIVGFNFGWIPLIDLAVEGSYVDFGKADDAGINVDADALAAFGVVGVNLGPIGIFGKVGAVNWDAKVSVEGVSADDDGTDPAYGIGARFQLGSFQIRAEYELFDIDAADVDFLSASLLYTF